MLTLQKDYQQYIYILKFSALMQKKRSGPKRLSIKRRYVKKCTISQEMQENSTGEEFHGLTRQCLRRRAISKIQKQNNKRSFVRKLANFNANMQLASHENQQKFNCPICMQIMVAASLLPCGHSFCLSCIEMSAKYSISCPLCREDCKYQETISSKQIRMFIDTAMQISDNEQDKKDYERKLSTYKALVEQERVPESIKVGDKIEFYVENSWRETTVDYLEQVSEKATIIKIRWQNQQRQLLLTSKLLAKSGTHIKPKPAQLQQKQPLSRYWRRQSIQMTQPVLLFDFSGLDLMEILDVI